MSIAFFFDKIRGLATKASPLSTDFLIIEDTEDNNKLKKVEISTLPSSGGGLPTLITLGDSDILSSFNNDTWNTVASLAYDAETMGAGGLYEYDLRICFSTEYTEDVDVLVRLFSNSVSVSFVSVATVFNDINGDYFYVEKEISSTDSTRIYSDGTFTIIEIRGLALIEGAYPEIDDAIQLQFQDSNTSEVLENGEVDRVFFSWKLTRLN